MPWILRSRTFTLLFAAQVIALIGSGLLTVALALLAYGLAGEAAGAVLGTALFIKMVAYVGAAPLIGALVARVDRKILLISADICRATVALALPFIDAVWQIYALIFLLQLASATFTPAFQALIPDVLPDEARYTRALSLSRIAYELETLVSPALAGLLLLVMSFYNLFGFTVLGFLLSAVLVARASLPGPAGQDVTRPFRERLTVGIRIYLATPRLRGLLALCLAAAAVAAFVIVNTVLMVQAQGDASETALAVALGAFGAGSMIAALSLPKLLERLSDREVMLAASGLLSCVAVPAGLWLSLAGELIWPVLLGLWALMGLGFSAVLTPSGRLLRRSAHAQDRPALFTAQFALSHACYLLTYPLAGWGGAVLGLGPILLILGAIALTATLGAALLWRDEADELMHAHPDLPANHPHLVGQPASGGVHRHAIVIDDLHPGWPRRG
ncbi:MAG: MFS transporter [Pseudomonadota bacterium]